MQDYAAGLAVDGSAGGYLRDDDLAELCSQSVELSIQQIDVGLLGEGTVIAVQT